ncbi:MAG: D-lyxose/D-mannose family sugar isomerase [Phycisphaeraceae bacterium JB051]
MQLTRSIINTSIDRALKVLEHFGIKLPPYAYWTPQQWQQAGEECDEIRTCMLGWDVTDFGSDDFFNIGRTLFTLRNGVHGHGAYGKSYAEKIILDPEGQRAPAHFHQSKQEDLINRFGGNLLVEMYQADDNGQRSDEPLNIQVDGISRIIQPGELIRLEPGQSLCICPRTIHQFWGEHGTGYKVDDMQYTVSGEVSSVCDDHNDNFFLDDMCRFPNIVEDEEPRYVLCHEYPKACKCV